MYLSSGKLWQRQCRFQFVHQRTFSATITLFLVTLPALVTSIGENRPEDSVSLLEQTNAQSNLPTDGIPSDNSFIIQTNAQDALILISSGLSVLKSMMACGTYSNWHVFFAFLEFVCSGLALALFVINDYTVDAAVQYEDDRLTFLLSFCMACILEILDLVLTFQTVREYKNMKKKAKKADDDNDLEKARAIRKKLALTKKNAKCSYGKSLVVAIILVGILPIIAFSKANWETDYFAPSAFSPQNGKFLRISIILQVVSQGFLLVVCCLTVCNVATMVVCFNFCAILLNGILVGTPAAILIYIVLARVEEGREAGSLTYLLMIVTCQSVEMAAENARSLVWVMSELSIDESPENDDKKLPVQLSFDEPDVEEAPF